MSGYCLTHINRSMIFFTIIYNGSSLKFFARPDIFKEYFNDQSTYIINCSDMTEKYFIYYINNLIGFIHDGRSEDDIDDEDRSVLYEDISLTFMNMAFSDPMKILEKETTILDEYKFMYEICSGTTDISFDLFKRMAYVLPNMLFNISTYCIVDSNDRIYSDHDNYFLTNVISARNVTGPICFFKNYGSIRIIKYDSFSKYDPKYDVPYTFDGNDYAKSLHRVLRYMLAKNMGFMPSIVLDNVTQIKTLLSGQLFNGLVDTIDFDEYVSYIDNILAPKKNIRDDISEDESDNDGDI